MRLVNGIPAETLSLDDRAAQFGDGVFRTLKLVGGGLMFWARQYRKLCADCTVLGIAVPDEAVLLADIRKLVVQSGMQDATIKLIVSRGQSQRGYVVPAGIQATRIVQIAPLPQYPESLYRQGAQLRVCQTRASWQPALAGVKHLNRLENILARREWSDPAILEGLLLDRDGYVQEGVMSNLLIRTGDELATPLLDCCGVAGMMREVALDAAGQLGWRMVERRLTLDNLLSAERVWVCNSLMGAVPVAKLEPSRWPVDAEDALIAQIAQFERKEIQWL